MDQEPFSSKYSFSSSSIPGAYASVAPETSDKLKGKEPIAPSPEKSRPFSVAPSTEYSRGFAGSPQNFQQNSQSDPQHTEFQAWLQHRAAEKLNIQRFHTEGSMRIWIQDFEQQATSAGIPLQIAVSVVPQHLPPDISSWLAARIKSSNNSWDNVKKILLNRYAHTEKDDSKLLLKRLADISQTKGMSIRDHASNFEYHLSLLLRPLKVQDQINMFIDSLYHLQMRLILYQKEFTTLDELIDAAITLTETEPLG